MSEQGVKSQDYRAGARAKSIILGLEGLQSRGDDNPCSPLKKTRNLQANPRRIRFGVTFQESFSMSQVTVISLFTIYLDSPNEHWKVMSMHRPEN